jgi:AraC-like DNA-binding protein
MDAGFDVFEHAVTELLPPDANAGREQPLDAAIRRIRTSGGTGSIERIANDAGLGRRQFERRFVERVGLPPRLFGRIIRFHRAFQRLGLESGAAIAASCGYADQAHLVREMRRFGGRTPTELRSAEGLNGFLLAPDGSGLQVDAVR